MSTASEVTIKALAFIVKPLPLGTNLAVLHLLWALLSGAFLSSRGAVFPALLSMGLSAAQIRRSSQAVRAGSWSSDELLARWRIWVAAQGAWQPDSYEGYQPLGVDITAFWRPRLGGWLGKFFNQVAQRALIGIGFALVVQVGHSGGQRLPLLKHIIRASNAADSERQLKATALATVGQHLAPHEVVVHDAGASIADMQTAQIGRYVVRLDRNCTARRNALPPRRPRRGRPTLYGTLVRPLARTYRQHELAATVPDVTTQFVHAGATIQAQGWRAVVRADQPVAPDNPTFTIWVFHSPRYPTPLVLGTNLPAQAVTILQLYLDRWPVEEVPLVSKQLLGVERQFVFAAEARYRLPELALLAANILAHVAAGLPALATGFWDRQPRSTPGRLRRALSQAGFPKDYPLDGRLREKHSVTDQLPKGVAAHRRHARPAPAPSQA
jgi:hypothetical protein